MKKGNHKIHWLTLASVVILMTFANMVLAEIVVKPDTGDSFTVKDQSDVTKFEVKESGEVYAPDVPTGATGPVGATPLCADGSKAGQLVPCDHGSWIGPQGDSGPDGATGPQGDTGPIGATGPQGLPGSHSITLGSGGEPGYDTWETWTGGSPVPMTPYGNSICFLQEIRVKDVDGSNEYGGCRIAHQGGNWVLIAIPQFTRDDDEWAYCNARCLLW